MKIRSAVIEDAHGIAKVHVDSWRTTYKNILPDEFLNKLSYERRERLWCKNILKEDNYVFVSENEHGEIIGFADCGKKEENALKNSGDLTSIYLHEDYQGKGIGKDLMKRLFLQFEELNYNHVFVEVLEDNKTRFFYEYYGAKLVKTEKNNIAGVELDLLTYEWDNVGEVVI